MYRSLSQLRDSINQLIEQQGEDAPCAAFVFTKEDVTWFDDEEIPSSTVFAEDVLADVGDSSYIYERIGEMIDDSILDRKNLPIYAS